MKMAKEELDGVLSDKKKLDVQSNYLSNYLSIYLSRERMQEAREELDGILSDDRTRDTILIVFNNKVKTKFISTTNV